MVETRRERRERRAQEDRERKAQRRNANNDTNPTPPVVTVRAELNLPQAVIDAYKAEQQQQNVRDRVRLGIEVLGILVLITTVLYTRDSVSELRRQVSQSQEHFTTDQRPYVWIDQPPNRPVRSIVTNQQITWHVFISNFGKSPAMKVATFGNVYHGRDAMAQADAFFRKVANRDAIGTVLMPGIRAVNYQTMTSLTPVSATDHEFIRNNENAVVLAVRVYYEDGAGGSITAISAKLFCLRGP